jgi:hypothetical protein
VPNALYAEPVTVTEGKFTPGIEGDLEEAGDASGEVTSAESGKPLKDIEVCYYDFQEYIAECQLTNEKGEYKTPPLAHGEYRVLFVSPLESGLNYASQFYGGFASRFDSPYIDIKPGDLTPGIDAQMAAGGRITGTVTNAGDGRDLEEALVCAVAGFGEIGGCAFTHADGQYAIEGLDAGKYDVQFEAEGFDGQSSSVVVSTGATVGGIDSALQPTSSGSPRNVEQPKISGNAAVGEMLECSKGSWEGSPRRPSPTVGYAEGTHRWARAPPIGCRKQTRGRVCNAKWLLRTAPALQAPSATQSTSPHRAAPMARHHPRSRLRPSPR